MTGRPPHVLDYSPTAPAPPTFLATTVGILLHPSLAFRTEVGLSDAGWFARIHTFIAALMLGIGTHLYVAYLSDLELFGTTTGHWSDGWFWIAMTVAWYVLFAAISRIVQRRLARQGDAEPGAAALDRRTAVLLHCAHLLPPATVILSTVLVYYRLNWSWTIRASDPPYPMLLICELVIGAAYLVLTFRIASRAVGDRS